jgi:hypothetical protein
VALMWSTEADVVRLISAMPDGFVPVYVKWTMQQTDAPAAYNLATALSLLAAVIPPHLHVKGLPDGDLYGNMYTLLVGRQGVERKSTAIRYGVRILEDAVPGRRGNAPGSPEGLITSLDEKPQQLLVYEDMATLFTTTQQRTGGNYMAGLKGYLLPLFDCAPVERQRARVLQRVEEPRLSILGGVNRPILDTYVDQADWETGFTSRFFAMYAERERTVHVRNELPAVREWLVTWLTNMAALADTETAWGDCLGLSPGAHRYLTAFTHAVEVTTPTGGGAASRTCGPRARVRTQALKIALLLSLSSNYGWPSSPGSQGADWHIPENIMRASIQIALMGFTGALAITASGADGLDMQKRQNVLDAVQTQWTSVGSILLAGRVLSSRCRDILRTLELEGSIEKRVAPSGDMEYRRIETTSHVRGVRDAIQAVQHLVDEYKRAVAAGVKTTPVGGSITLPPQPLNRPTASGAGPGSSIIGASSLGSAVAVVAVAAPPAAE